MPNLSFLLKPFATFCEQHPAWAVALLVSILVLFGLAQLLRAATPIAVAYINRPERPPRPPPARRTVARRKAPRAKARRSSPR